MEKMLIEQNDSGGYILTIVFKTHCSQFGCQSLEDLVQYILAIKGSVPIYWADDEEAA